jgi:hypothetical protein
MKIIWKKTQNQPPLQNQLKTFPNIEMSLPYDIAQEKFIFEIGDPLGQPEHLEGTEGQPFSG